MAEVERAEIGHEGAELHDQRLVEAVPLVERLPRLERGVDRQVEVGGTAGQARQEEHEHDQPDQGEQAVERASAQIGAHQGRASSAERRPSDPKRAGRARRRAQSLK